MTALFCKLISLASLKHISFKCLKYDVSFIIRKFLIFYVKAIRSLGIGDILRFPIYFDVISIVVKRPYVNRLTVIVSS